MADKFNLDGFSVGTNDVCTADGGFVGDVTGDVVSTSISSGASQNMNVASELVLTLTGTTELYVDSPTGKVYLTTSLPATDPGVALQLWADSSDGYTVKVSQG